MSRNSSALQISSQGDAPFMRPVGSEDTDAQWLTDELLEQVFG